MAYIRRPEKYGLYDPAFEKDSCGVGFVAHIKGKRSHSIISDAKEVLVNMAHRGAVGSEKNTGDGAGILVATPYEFLEKAARAAGFTLPERGLYGAGIVFLSRDASERQAQKKCFEETCTETGLTPLGWRAVPRDNSMLGEGALACEPCMQQVFVGGPSKDTLDVKLFVARKLATKRIRSSQIDKEAMFYVCSLSSRVIVYKGMLTPAQLFPYFHADLDDPEFISHLCMHHSRFSTNTFPSWDRAHPFRYISHNGEINTLRGNINKMKGREVTLASQVIGDDLKKLLPVIEPDLSDSGTFDNALELLYIAGRPLQEAVMMMIPEAWQNHSTMSDEKRAFYEFQSNLIEPWDGPASITFTDGHVIGAVLDRNGLRPSRYYITDDERVIMASEVGALSIPPEKIISKGRLQPGRMFLVDFEQGRIVDDAEIKKQVCGRHPYRRWIGENKLEIKQLHIQREAHAYHPQNLMERFRLFGYTFEHLRLLLKPMADDGKEALGSMGNDAALAVLSDKPRLSYEYFKQLFAQVTNPPIDSIREEIIMSLRSNIGPQGNLLDAPYPKQAHRMQLRTPFLTNEELDALKHVEEPGWECKIIDITYSVSEQAERGLLQCLDKICKETEDALEAKCSFVVLSDRAAGPQRIPVSALIAVGAVHQHLIRIGRRTEIGVLLESGEPRETHHFCLLMGYGADAVNPYLAYEAMWKMQRDGNIRSELSDSLIVVNYTSALEKGMRKVFGKMGISTLESYKGAQIFEAVGLSRDVVERCFAGTASRIGGAGFAELAGEAKRRHELAYTSYGYSSEYMRAGDLAWRTGGEKHMWDPESIANLQIAVRQNKKENFKVFCDRQNARTTAQATLRGLLKFKTGNTPVPPDEVEPVSAIVRRFVTGAMSFGSISKEAHETLAIAMNRLGGKSNTGEGGEDPERFKPLPGGDSKRSAIKQVASGRFGVTINYLTNADELQIKMAQGAKPGEGGELPGHKVVGEIAKTRHSTPGVGLISPPPHHDIYSIEDLAQLIFDLKNANPKARISVKLVSEVGVGTVAAGVAKAHADHILISGHDGGTGASPLTGIKYAGLPWELGLAETHQTLVMNDLRSRVVLQTDGQLKTARDVLIAGMLGAEEFGFATAALISLGCVMMRKCEQNTCPAGIATQDPRLRAKFAGSPEHVIRFFTFLAEDIRALLAELGFRKFEDIVGRADLLETDEAVRGWKSKGVDLSDLLVSARKKNPDSPVVCRIAQDHGIDNVLDRRLMEQAAPAVEQGKQVLITTQIRNTDRAVGGMLSNYIVSRKGAEGLAPGTVHVKFTGSAGQSFGAWLAKGVTMELEGDANDYVGKGLSGGQLIIYPPESSKFIPEENILLGNVALYGATSGRAFFRGVAAERFCVRNSGADVVVEGVGDHGCEYMTGGRAVILGPTGRNFAAGMSGGIAFVWDKEGKLRKRVTAGNMEVTPLESAEDENTILRLVKDHHRLTRSGPAEYVLANWDTVKRQFLKVISPEYRRTLQSRAVTQSGEDSPPPNAGTNKLEAVHG
ncbi:MAG: glutamate synthase large subunit [Spirochaetales bacterium]|jgi:glutamate synthase (NADPH/NADH) large chain|nr:glutamate synthase large subunit [Spirochaetales bacterium]